MSEVAAAPPDGPSAELCAACGACCDGTLYASVPLGGDEEPFATRVGLPMFDAAQGRSFRQPCVAHRGAGCAVYEERPRVCASYRCALLAGVQAGAIELARALAVAGRVKGLSGSVRARLSPGDGGLARPLWEAVRAFADQQPPGAGGAAWRRDHADLLADIAALLAQCQRHLDAAVGPFPTSMR